MYVVNFFAYLYFARKDSIFTVSFCGNFLKSMTKGYGTLTIVLGHIYAQNE